MSTRMLLSAGIIGAAMLGAGCHKSQPGETTPEQAAGEPRDTARATAGAARDSAAAAAGAYRDTAAAAAGAARDTAAAGLPDTTGLRRDTSGLLPDTSRVGGAVDSVRRDSM
jgi:hypothetical protein